jgi:tetratricopeptide (TPR) repeat protein
LENRENVPLIAGVLLIGTFVVYWPSIYFGFTNLDDPVYVTENPVVQAGLTWTGIKWAFVSTSSFMWHPLTWLAHMTTWELFGPVSGGHHLINILLHAANAVLVFLLFRRMTGSTMKSAFIAALFAWHPLRVESVAWVAELKDVLAMLFWLLTIWCYVRFLKSGRHFDRLALIAVFALGLMTKPMLVTLPFSLLLLDIWPLQRLRLPFSAKSAPKAALDDNRPAGAEVSWRHVVQEKIPLFVLSLAFSILSIFTSQGGTAVAKLPIAERVANAFVSYARYLGKAIYPSGLTALYPHPGHWPMGTVAGAVLLIVILSAIVVWLGPRFPFVFMGWFWFVGILVPVIGIVQVGPQAMADRFTYIPSLGLLVILVWGVVRMSRHLPFGTMGAAALGFVAVGLSVVMTRATLPYWQNSITLFERALAVTEQNKLAHYNLAQALSVAGRVPEAIPHYEAAIRIDAEYDAAWNNLGLCFAVRGEQETAQRHYLEALRINPDNWDAHYNYGLGKFFEGNLVAAFQHLSETARIHPGHYLSRYWLGRTLVAQGKMTEAIANFERSIELNPGFPEGHYELGVAWMKQGQADTAAVHLRAALQFKPDYSEAHAKMARLLAEQRDPLAAIAQYRQALTIDPNHVESLDGLAWLLATHRDSAVRNGEEAVKLANHACAITTNQVPGLVSTLAAAYAESGRFEEANRTVAKAVELATQLGLTNVAAKGRELAKLFRDLKPYRDPQ